MVLLSNLLFQVSNLLVLVFNSLFLLFNLLLLRIALGLDQSKSVLGLILGLLKLEILRFKILDL